MTDINIAYSYDDEKEAFYAEQSQPSQTPKKQVPIQPPPQAPQYQLPPPPPPPPQIPQYQSQMMKQEPERFMNMYNMGGGTPEYSFWDRMVLSRREVLKLFILSLVIVIGISLERIGCHYITNYINSNDLTTLQELLVRFSYPVSIIVILWIIKSL